MWVAIPVDWVILHWYACGADGQLGGRAGGRAVGRCTVTWWPNFLRWVDYHISLAMGPRPRAARGAPLGSSVKDRKKLKRVVKACSWFYARISSLLINPELQSEIGSYRSESTFFGYWIKFLLILFEKHPFIFIKLFITDTTLQHSINFNVNNFTSILKW